MRSGKQRGFTLAKLTVLVVAIIVAFNMTVILTACGDNNGSNGNGNNGNPISQGGNKNYEGMFLGWGVTADNVTMNGQDAAGTVMCWLNPDLFIRFQQENFRPSSGSYVGQNLELTSNGYNGVIGAATLEMGEFSGYGTIYKIVANSYTLSYDGGTIGETNYEGIYYSIERGILTREEYEAVKRAS